MDIKYIENKFPKSHSLRFGYKTILESFEEKIERIPETGCWIWVAYITRHGYGMLRFNKKTYWAHRLSWEIHACKPIPKGLHVLHRCDTPSCVNPHHLFLGTAKENIADMFNKKRNPPRYGEYASKARLKNEDVMSIRNSSMPHSELAKIYSIDASCICRIRNGNSWKHLIGGGK